MSKTPRKPINTDDADDELLDKVAESTGDALKSAYQEALNFGGFALIFVDGDLNIQHISLEEAYEMLKKVIDAKDNSH